MKIPTTYAEWSLCLDSFDAGTDDDEAIGVMSAGSLSWTGGVAPLFARRISETVDTRLKRIADGMSRALRLGGDTTTLARAMLDARQKLATLHRLSAIPVFAAELRDGLQTQVMQYAQRAQQALEDSAKNDRSGRLASTIRNNSLLHYQTNAAATPAVSLAGAGSANTSSNNGMSAASPQRRRNILA